METGSRSSTHRGSAPHGDLAPLAGQRWDALTHTDALVELIRLGWTLCGVGDWAVGLRSPSGACAARVCPFDPAHAAYLELCRRCPSNPYLPRVDLAVALDGGGALTVMEFLAPVDAAVAAEVTRRWQDDDRDTDFDAVRRGALAVDSQYRTRVPWWDGIDLNEGNVGQTKDGQLALIDLFCMDGAALYGQILKDAAVVRRRIPEDQRRYVLEIPYLARVSTPDELRALRRAWAH